MKKLILTLSVICAATLSWSQSCPDGLADSIGFNVEIRDFQPSHPDFENFDDRWKHISANPLYGYTAFSPQCFGKTNPPPAAAAQNYMVCEDGYPCGVPKPDGSYPAQTMYGEYRIGGQAVRGHRHLIQRSNPSVILDNVKNWEDPVWVTRGMVQSELLKVNPNDPLTWIPVKNDQKCNNTFFDQWYTDNATYNRTVQEALYLKRVSCYSKQYRIDSKDMPSGSFFPLDKYDGNASVPNFGKQSLKLWCPPYGPISNVCGSETATCEGGQGEAGPSGSLEHSTCTSLLALGGPRNVDAVNGAVAANPGSEALLHNYSFTMMGYNSFEYSPMDTFLFSGDDDMWIFLDGKLVVDLGGTHLPAEARVAMKDWGDLWGWKEGETHDLHFYYADRQSEASNFSITTTLGKVRHVDYGPIKINEAEITKEGSLLIYLNQQISEASKAQILTGTVGSGYFPFLVIKRYFDDEGLIYRDTMGLAITSFVYNFKNSEGLYVYELSGSVYSNSDYSGKVYSLSTLDSLSFNFISEFESHKFMAGVPANIKSEQSKIGLDYYSWKKLLCYDNWCSNDPPPISVNPSINKFKNAPCLAEAYKTNGTIIENSKLSQIRGILQQKKCKEN